MPVEITMPQLSDTMTEGTVVKWIKKEGDKVKAGEIIAEIETDKANMETEAFEGGTLAHIAAKEGDKVAVGKLIAVLAKAGENAAEIKQQYAKGAAAPAAAAPAPTAEAAPAPAATAKAAPAPRQAPARVVPAAAPQPVAAATATIEAASRSEIHEPDHVGHGATREPASPVPPIRGNGDNGHRVFVSPLARRMAADKGIDLSRIQGTGPNGRIVQADVLSATAASSTPAATSPATPPAARPEPAPISPGQSESIPLSKMRVAIAAALQRSKQQVPHFYISIEVDVEQLSALRVRLNKQLESKGIKLSLNDFVSKAVTAALIKHPALNAHFRDDAITRFGDVHLGIAVAIPDGLIVPVMKNADRLGLADLQTRTAELAKKAKAQKLKGDEMKGATFTISNLGMFGVKEFSAIINPPEVAILAVAAAQKRPAVVGDQVVPRAMMTLTLSVDHRAVDGATAAEFLRTLKGLLEEPGMMLV